MSKTYLSTRQVATVLGVSEIRAYQIIHSPGFPAIKIGRRLRIPEDEFIAWLDSHRINVPTKEDTEK